jgi:hypothetical protein
MGSVVALVALAAMAIAQGGATLQRVAKVGDTARYRLQADIELAGQEATFTATVTERVVRVEPNGDYAVESVQSEGKVSFAGTSMDAPAGAPSTTIYKATGEVVQMRGEMVDSNAYRIANLGLFRVPGKAVTVGDAWTHSQPADPKTGAVAVRAEYKIEGEEKVGNHDVFRVKMTVKEIEGGEPAINDSIVWINRKDGSTVKLEAKWTNAPIPGAPGPVNSRITLVRVD